MESSLVTPLSLSKSATHPLLLVAASSVTALSLAGVGLMAGWLPGPNNAGFDAARPIQTASAAMIAPVPAPMATPTAVPVSPVTIQQTFNLPQDKPAVNATHTDNKPTTRTAANTRTATPTARRAQTVVTPAQVPLPAAPVICSDCGSVEAVRTITSEPKASGGGAVVGGLLGGIVGNQIGAGSGRNLATLAGIFGGAIAGNAIEKNVRETTRYDVVVRFEDGKTRTFSSDTLPVWQSGDRVKLDHGVLTERDGERHGSDYRGDTTGGGRGDGGRGLGRAAGPDFPLGTI